MKNKRYNKRAHSFSPTCCFCVLIGLSNIESINLSVASTINGSAFGNGNPVVDGKFAILIISVAGNRARDATVCDVPGVAGVGEAAADAPRDERSGVRGLLSCDTGTVRLLCGVTGSWVVV